MKKTSFRKIVHDLDKQLLFLTIVFFVVGLLSIVNASSRVAVVNYDYSLYYYFYRQLIFICIGFCLTIFILKIDTKNYKILIPFMFILMIALNIWALTSREISGSNNWIDLKFMKLQPSEMSKIVMIAFLAILFEKYYRKLRTLNIPHYEMIGKIIIVGITFPLLVILQKDLGTALILLIIFCVMFLVSPILKIDKFRSIIFMVALACIALFIVSSKEGSLLNEARLSRFSSFTDPCGNYENGGGYQVCNGYIAINNGGLNGLGIGKSKQKYSYIPEPHTDSAFAILAEENGVIRITFVFALYIWLIYRILDIASKASTLRGRYICLGVATYIFTHIFVNLGGILGVIPLTGVPLPFFSYGGSFAISLLAALAMVQRVNIETKNKKIKVS